MDGFENLVISNLESLREGQWKLVERMDQMESRIDDRLDTIESSLQRKLDRDDLSIAKILDTWPKRVALVTALLAAIGVPFLPNLERLIR
jgi:hypothetical protein